MASDCDDGREVATNRYGTVVRDAGDYYACATGRPGSFFLGPADDGGASANSVVAYNLRLRGRFVAFELNCACSEPASDIRRFDLRRSREPRDIATTQEKGAFGYTSELVVSRAGNVAWSTSVKTDGKTSKELWLKDSGPAERLSRSKRIRGLRLERGFLRWTENGRPRRHRVR